MWLKSQIDIFKNYFMLYFIMPANLPPEYYAAEKQFREAISPQEKIYALEELIATIPKHKGTDKLRADMRRKLSQLREEAIKKKKSGKGDIYTVEKQGAAQIALVGFANSGKSSLLKSLTNANPVIADYPVSTIMPLAGMMPFEDIQFQLVDLPPIGNESTDGWVSGILRVADMLLLIIDISEDPDIQVELLIEQLENWKIKLIKKNEPSSDSSQDKPIILVANKIDLLETIEDSEKLLKSFDYLFPVVKISTIKKDGLEELRRTIFENSRIIRVYSKEPGKEPDKTTPFILPSGSTVLELAEMIHKDFLSNFKYVCIWGSAKFGGQRVQKDYILHDKDIVEYHLK